MKYTSKEEKFCRLIVEGKSQIDAYRQAFNTKNMKTKTVYEAASRLRASSKISARIDELTKPIVESIQMTKVEWLRGLERLVNGVFKADTRKMYDSFGNPVEIRELGDHEEVLVDGYEFEEQYTKVKKADGGTEAVPTGYTKKIKLSSRIGTGIKAAIELGKVMGWYTEKKELELGATLEELVLGSMKK